MKGNHFKKFKTVLIAMLFIVISGYMLISTAIAALTEDVDVSKVKNIVDINLEKYVNYNLDEKKGSLLQLNVKTGIEYEEGTEYVPLSSTGILLNVPKINNKFPQSVEVFEKSTKATNGDEQGKDVRYKYVSETGQLIILTTNEEENGEIYKEYVKGARDNISVVLDYDESFRFEENTKNELDITGFVQTKFATQKETKVQDKIKATIEVEKEVSNLVSSDVKTSDIYNGFIKMNAKNDSNYKTTYNEEFGINISKKDLADETKIEIENSFIKNEEKTVIKDIAYVSSKINKNKILDILGQDGYFKILDEAGDVLAEINKDTQVDQEGNYEIKYLNGTSRIFAVFSKPNKVGYIKINSTKEIQPSFKEVDVNKLQVVSKISSVNKVKDAQNDEIEKEVYKFEDIKEIEIKNTQTVVKLAVNNAKWTNQKQNEIELNVKLLASESSHSLFKNPIIKIQVPEEVEKVVLGDVKVTNGNGLSFKNIEYNNENRIITVTLEGEQTEYLSKNLAEGTNVIIPAIVILGQEIESKNTNIGVAYVNEATSEKGMFKVDVEVENFRQVQNQENEITNSVPTVVRQAQRAVLRSETPNVETAEGVEIEVIPTRCTDVLNNGDVVYEGEFIKYNIKVKNTTDHDLENVKLIADLPDGVKYVKEIGEFGENIFEYDEEIRQLPIEIEKIEKGQQINKDFQVRVKDLENNGTEKQIETNIKVYIGNGLSDVYRFSNKIQKAEYQVALIGKNLDYTNFVYELDIDGNKENKVKVKLNLPENLEINMFQGLEENLTIEETNQKNIYNVTPGKYTIVANPIEPFVKQENCNSLKLSSTAIVNDKYKSNELVVIYKYKNLSIEISSPTAGEKLKCNQEIIYNIKVKNITEKDPNGNDLLSVALKDRLPKELNPINVTYTNYYWNDETDLLEKKEKVEEVYNLDEEDDNSYNVYLLLQIPAQEEVELVVKAKVGIVSENTEITNVTIVEDLNEYKDETNLDVYSSRIGKISSNIIKNTVLTWEESNTDENSNNEEELIIPIGSNDTNPEEPISEEGLNEPDYPISEGELDEQGNIENITNLEEQDNQENIINNGKEEINNSEVVDKKYSITGLAWKDENEDGQKQDNEEKLSGIEVILVDSNGKDISTTTTDNDGQYAFNNLNNGNYIVAFKYDVSKYRLTEYQKNGVEDSYNSDAIKTERNIEGKSTICGVTNLIKLNSTLENIDVGLIENKKFNFKVDKYISKVTTTTSKGTDSKDYNNVKLAKTEIKSKEVENVSVKVEYKIVITNDGEVPGTVGKVVEKLPQGLKLSSDVNNKTWYKNQDGSLVNTSMAGQIIEPGKKLELELIADVSNNSGVIGNYKNTVILEEISNTLGIVDNNTEDNSSSTELIVSVSTGAVIYISIIIIVIAILGLLIFLNKKYGIFKHIKAVRLFIGVLLFSGVICSYMGFLKSYTYDFPVVRKYDDIFEQYTYDADAFIKTEVNKDYNYKDESQYSDENYKKGIEQINGSLNGAFAETFLNYKYGSGNLNSAYFVYDNSCTLHKKGNSACFTMIPTTKITLGTNFKLHDDLLQNFSEYQHKARCIDYGNDANNAKLDNVDSGELKKIVDKVKETYDEKEKAEEKYSTWSTVESTLHKDADDKLEIYNNKDPHDTTSTKYNDWKTAFNKWKDKLKELNGKTIVLTAQEYTGSGNNKWTKLWTEQVKGEWNKAINQLELAKTQKGIDYNTASDNLTKFGKEHPKIFLKYFSIQNWKNDDLFCYKLSKIKGEEKPTININLDHKGHSRTETVETQLKNLGNGNYLIGPLTIVNNSTDEYKQVYNESQTKKYVFRVTYKNGSKKDISTTYDSTGKTLNYTDPKGEKTFYLKLTKDEILTGEGISDIAVGIKPKQAKSYSYTKEIQKLRVWWPIACNTKDENNLLKLYQRTIEIPDDGNEVVVEDYVTETVSANPIILHWKVDSEIVEIKKKEQFSTTKDLSGINFIIYKDGAGWVQINNGIISYKKYDANNPSSFNYSSLVKLTTKSDGSTDPLIGLSTGKYYVFEIVECNWNSSLDLPSRFRPYYKGIGYSILPRCTLKKVETKEVKTGKNVFNETNNWDYLPVQLQKVDEIGDVDDLSGINFVLYKKDNGAGWVRQDRTVGSWSTADDTEKLLKLKTGKDGLTPVYQGLERGDYIVFEIVKGSTGYESLSMPVKLRQLYKETIIDGKILEYAGCTVKKLETITVKDPTSAAAQVITAKNSRDKVKITIKKVDEFNNEKIDLSGITFLLYRSKDENGEAKARGWAAYDKDGLINYVPWGDTTKDNIKNLVKLKTNKKNAKGEYVTYEIEGLERGYYTVYEFIEGYDDYTNTLNLPEQLRKYYKGNPFKTAGCSLKHVGYIDLTKSGYNIVLNKGKKTETKSNPRDFVDYRLHKIDPNEKVNLEGIQFKIYKHEVKVNGIVTEPAGWIKWTKNSKGVNQIDEDPKKAVTTYDKSSTLITDTNGYTEQIEKFLTTRTYDSSGKGYDVIREYDIYEVDVGNYDKHYEIGASNGGVKMPGTDKYGKLIETWKSQPNKEGCYTREQTNDQYYISLSGNVWEDGKKGKNSRPINNSYGNEDNNISGITVRLVNKTGNLVKQTVTNSNGAYTFDKVLVSEIKAGNYHIEFLYDGIVYQTVNQDKGLNGTIKVGTKTVSIPKSDTSKAGETSSRTDLNNAFASMRGDGQGIIYNGIDKRLVYNKDKKGSEEKDSSDFMYLEQSSEYDWERTEAANNKKGTVKIKTQGAFQVTATIDANYLKNAYTKMKEGYKDNTKELLFTIPNLNLGLYQREKVDLALSKDTYSAQIDINGKKYTYLYGQKLDESVQNLIEKDIQTAQVETSLGVGFERKNPLSNDFKYNTAIHKADVEYELNGNTNAYSNGELKVTITYAIGLVNNSHTLYGKVNRIKEYYSSDYTFADKKVYADKECTTPLNGVIIENESTLNNAKLGNDNTSRNYKTFDINFGNSGIVLTPKTNKDCVKYIYVKMELPKSQFYDFVNHKLYDNKEFRNFAEISSYTTYSAYNANNKTGTLYATYDYNSVPNTINTTNPKLRKHERDDDFAPGLQLVLAEERTLSGTVFKDNIDGTIGRKNAAEKGIQNVTVQLVPANKLTKNTENYTPEFMNVTSDLNDVKKYYNDRGLNGDALTVKTNDKGEFTFKGFIPGDYQIRYIWGSNNGTIIKDGNDTKVSVGEYKSTKYTDVSNNKWYLNESANSRAIDSWKERLEFDKDLPASYNDYVTYNEEKSTKVKGNMNSWTPKLDMGVEVVGNQNQNYIVVDESGNAKYKYDIKSVNFGLIERAKQQLEVKKELTHLRIKDAQDRVIVDAEVEIKDGKKTFKNINDVLYTVLLPESTTNPSGTVKSEIDKDYMPVKLEATYKVTVTNTSQADYKDKDYYYYYKGTNNPVKLKATKVYDYISKDFDVNESSDANYKVETLEDYNKEINNSINKASKLYSSSSSKTIIEAAFEEYKVWAESGYTEKLLADGTKVTSTNWATGSTIIKSLYEEWYNIVTTKKPVRTVKLDGNKVINLQALEQSLTVGQSVSSTYTVTSLIQNKDDEIKLDNEVEIIDIDRDSDFGKTTINTYKKLYDAGESVIITPPTGEDRSKEEVNILAISLASGLSVLGIGLIFIKRRISKHNKNA